MASSTQGIASALIFLALFAACAVATPCGNTLGPVQQSGGFCFGVWAPHASSAQVVPMNGASFQTTSMTFNSTSGAFFAFVAGASVGDGYVYKFNGNVQRLDPRAQGIASGTGPFSYSVIHGGFEWSTPEFTPPGPEKTIVYEMHIPSFNAQNGEAGTFASAAAKLPYFAKLGVNMLELMPVATFCGGANEWGYNPCAPYAVMNAFGGANGLKTFVQQANQYGIGVMLDIVWNHMDGGNVLKDFDGYAGGEGNGIYFYETALNAETFWGPRPNYASTQVTQYILDSVDMWLSEYRISGFRWDSTVCIRKPAQSCWTQTTNLDQGWELMQAANTMTLNKVPNAITAAEDSQGWAGLTLPVSDKSSGYPDAPGGAGFVSQWGYRGFFYNFFTQLTLSSNSNVDMAQVATMLTTSTEGRRVLFTENHDMASNQNHGRIPNVVNPGGSASSPTYWAVKKATFGMGAVLTAPGIPMLLQGQEHLSYATFQFPTPPNVDWSLTQTNAGIVQMVTDLISLRLNKNGTSPGLTTSAANTVQLVNEYTSKIAVVHRGNGGSSGGDILVIYNMYNSKCGPFTITGVPTDGTYNVLFNSDLSRYSSLNQNCGASQSTVQISGGSGTVQLPEYSILILGSQ